MNLKHKGGGKLEGRSETMSLLASGGLYRNEGGSEASIYMQIKQEDV